MSIEIKQAILTKNDCFKAGQKITVKGLMLHSTGANNPKLCRYVSPDDGILGTPSSSHWNQPRPGGRQVCVHGFIGKDKDGVVRTYQTLPWNHRGWHAGGAANDTHIGVEICEDDLKDPVYFAAVYKESVELFAMLCKQFNLNPDKDIICHSEGYKLGIASNHADVMHWFPKHGKSMDTFRKDVKKKMATPTPSNAHVRVVGNSEYVGRKLIVKNDGLWFYNAPRWEVCDGTSDKGHTFTIVEELIVDGRKMVKCHDGKYRTADPNFVEITPKPLDWPYNVQIENITHKEAQEIVRMIQSRYKAAKVYGVLK
ncbi:N-acetylmuramoyl-L-alanine amidase family protein [Bacillus sp. 1P02SD]|uniref:peptidoglycan recognition protein family protein n=1 Tax=Bacillus sp. 1P02SD TaxID=3132264 RepID=UPI0039A0B1DC